MADPTPAKPLCRRDFFRRGAACAAGLALAGMAALGARRTTRERLVWQLDPRKCVQCGRCATRCVLSLSAVKCVHAFAMCGYCKRCFGFFRSDTMELNSGAENQTCPTGAICRTFVEDPYFEYTLDEKLCNGCGKCVKGCGAFGNGSLFLQVRHDRCLNCNECAIARTCPADAFQRVPAEHPYLLKDKLPPKSG
ncbi:MAG: ferredoxin [Lentisphaerae bacterium RIFOXYB12_FULL_65_16]|nr:MAG: ferredoxin [Lentisphaerae bacterium RIFOXYA12_64_32]OGV88480.1 MAG: ferredoxin [Lentisphaerae bacterium RIFOXYB12_FULL_65_16]